MMMMMRFSLIQHNALHTCYCFVFIFLLSLFSSSSEAYDALDPYGNITIKWDLVQWQADGYIAMVTINNYQEYRHIPAPGWSLTWTWAEKELIWNITGAMTTEQGDCSWFKGYHPLSCNKSPTVVDLLPSTPYSQKVPNCCKGGVLTSLAQDPTNAVASFQITVGRAGTTNRTVRVPRNFTFNALGSGYTCGVPKIVRPTRFITPDKRRITQALMTWNVTCTYSRFLAEKAAPTCCLSLSSFYNDTRVPCPTCSCACNTNSTCLKENRANLSPVVGGKNPLVECSNHMCPISIHWHLNLNNKDYWRVNVTITNFSYRMNYSDWNLLIQHPNFNNNSLIQVFGLKYKLLTPFDEDMAMFWGIKFYNNVVIEAGRHGNNVEFEVLFRKDKFTSSKKGWAFPQGVYFNGDQCVMPPPHSYPWLPNA